MRLVSPDLTAVIRHLSGRRRGQVETVADKTREITVDDDADVRIRTPDPEDGAGCIARLHSAGPTYELEVVPDRDVWVNGERVAGNRLLCSGDLIELGHGGPLLRFRLYPPGEVPRKSLAEVFSDSVDGAKSDGRTGIGRTGTFIARFSHDLVTQTSTWFRVWVMTLITVLVISVALLAVRYIQLERHVFSEAVRIDSIAEVLRKTGADAIGKEELAEVRNLLELRLETLEAREEELPRTLAMTESSIAFVQGSYGFSDPESGKPLRYSEEAEGVYLFSVEGEGELVELPFTGTAFVIGKEGLLMTNKHVAEPWLEDERSQVPVELGLMPEHRRMRVFYPGDSKPYPVEHLVSSDHADLALLKMSGELGLEVVVLGFAATVPRPGDEILVVGYPLGIRGILARVGGGFIEQASRDDAGFWELVDRLAQNGHIRPLASRGIVSQVSDDYVVYDAETATGGSGGPVLDSSGSVIAVNTAVVGEFGGSNLGVLSSFALRLIDRYRQGK